MNEPLIITLLKENNRQQEETNKKLDTLIEILDEGTTDIFSISGSFNKEGKYIEYLEKQAIYEGRHYRIVCNNFAIGNITFNVLPGVNDKFHYDPGTGTYITKTVTDGMYNAELFTKEVKRLIGNDNIVFEDNNSCSRTNHILKNNYKVKWKPDTPHKVLGYKLNENTNELILSSNGISEDKQDLNPHAVVRLHCNLVGGLGQNIKNKITGKSTGSDVIFTFYNNFKTGDLIEIKPDNDYTLGIRRFNQIHLTCTDDNDNPLDFSGDDFNIELEIFKK